MLAYFNFVFTTICENVLREILLYQFCRTFRHMDLHWQRCTFHSGRRVNCITKDTILRHLLPDNSGGYRSAVYTHSNLYFFFRQMRHIEISNFVEQSQRHIGYVFAMVDTVPVWQSYANSYHLKLLAAYINTQTLIAAFHSMRSDLLR